MTRAVRPILVASVLLAASATADARPHRVNQVPNGGEYRCGTCHVSDNSGGLRNQFGMVVESFLEGEPIASANVTWNAELAAGDADGDGYTNGEELGDPDGTWTSGDAPESYTASRPGWNVSTLCGNGTLEGEEECDTDELDGATCADFEIEGGTLGCSVTCEFDTSSCGESDAGSDAGGSDAGGSDAGGSDAGASDAGGTDVGGSDAGSDAGGADVGGSDAGVPDADDASMSDAGMGGDTGMADDTGASDDTGGSSPGGSSGGGSGGCASAPQTTTGAAWLALLGGLFVIRRRR